MTTATSPSRFPTTQVGNGSTIKAPPAHVITIANQGYPREGQDDGYKREATRTDSTRRRTSIIIAPLAKKKDQPKNRKKEEKGGERRGGEGWLFLEKVGEEKQAKATPREDAQRGGREN